MVDTRGFYQKYNVTRVDGRPIEGPTFTLELDHDPHSHRALRGYIDSLREEGNPAYTQLISDLEDVLDEVAG